MAETQLLRGNQTGQPPVVPDQYYQLVGATSVLPGQPVYKVADLNVVAPARANAVDTTMVVGLAVYDASEDNQVALRYAGPISLTEAQWDAVTGDSGGLEQGATYYLSAAVAGRITTTAPSSGGQFVSPIGVALSSATLLLQLGVAVEN